MFFSQAFNAQTGRDAAQKAAFEGFLADRGYTVAPFTIEHDDHLFSCVYDHASAEQRAEVQREYLGTSSRPWRCTKA